MEKEKLLETFQDIMLNELQIRLESPTWTPRTRKMLEKPEMIYNVVWRIFEICKLNFVPRSYNSSYGLDDSEIVYESVGAHTNLALNIMEHAISFCYGEDFGRLEEASFFSVDGYSYRDMVEVMMLHDLAENMFGDVPDNGDRNEALKDYEEFKYIKKYVSTFPDAEHTRKANILDLFRDMQRHNNSTGRLLYLSDKVAALIVTLCLDAMGHAPILSPSSKYASMRDRQEMDVCDFCLNGKYRASEMWAIDYFEMRYIVELDRTFFFTAIVAMATLMVNGRWYSWREKDYGN